jgi:hypothetical protein
MPDVDGLELLRYVRSNQQLDDLPVISEFTFWDGGGRGARKPLQHTSSVSCFFCDCGSQVWIPEPVGPHVERPPPERSSRSRRNPWDCRPDRLPPFAQPRSDERQRGQRLRL